MTGRTGDAAILVEELAKSYGRVRALQGIDLTVPAGSVLGVLGPNGAGKTTLIRILTTLLRPDSGRAMVAGWDVVREARAVRRLIGLAGQSPAVHDELTGRENLQIVAGLYHLGKRAAAARADELLDQFDLTEAAGRPAKTYSGGMKRRLDLAASLAGRPAVLFLDEPTAGLDPTARIATWGVVRELVAAGTTLLLTTQYLDEADALADRIVVIDHGQVIAAGAPEQLKSRVGGDVLEFVVVERYRITAAAEAVSGAGDAEAVADAETGRVGVRIGAANSGAVLEIVRRLDAAGIAFESLTVRRPSLDDVFASVTSASAADRAAGPPSSADALASAREGS